MKKNILWIDNDICDFDVFVDELKKKFGIVQTAKNYEDAVLLCDKYTFNIFLIDIKMPHPNGIEITRRLYERFPTAIYIVFSSYLYLARYKDELSALDFRVSLLDKHLTNTQNPLFKLKFIEPVTNIANGDTTYIYEKNEQINQDTLTQDPFNIDYTTFLKMPLVEKDRLTDKVESLKMDVIENQFKKGIIWILFCGTKGDIAASAENKKQILTEKEILRIAKLKNRAFYQFGISYIIDDIKTSCSESSTSLHSYPTISLEFDGNRNEYHFDSGSPDIFFSYEELIEKGLIENAVSFAKEYRKGYRNPFRFVPIAKLNSLLVSQRDDQKKAVVLTGRAVRDWNDSVFARNCNIECDLKNEQEIENNLCPFRRALIGRNFLTDNKIALILDGRHKKTDFEKNGK